MSSRTRDIELCSTAPRIPSVVSMNTSLLSHRTGPATQERSTSHSRRRRAAAFVPGLVTAAVVLWALWRAAGVDLAVDTGSGVRQVGPAAVAITTALVAVAALGLYRLLHRRGLRTWTVVALAAWLVSFLGPTTATTTEAGLALASLHLLVGAGVIAGVHLLHRAVQPCLAR
jgi:hypothetical protein